MPRRKSLCYKFGSKSFVVEWMNDEKTTGLAATYVRLDYYATLAVRPSLVQRDWLIIRHKRCSAAFMEVFEWMEGQQEGNSEMNAMNHRLWGMRERKIGTKGLWFVDWKRVVGGKALEGETVIKRGNCSTFSNVAFLSSLHSFPSNVRLSHRTIVTIRTMCSTGIPMSDHWPRVSRNGEVIEWMTVK